MKINNHIEEFPNYLSDMFNKIIDMPQPVPKGNPFKLKIHTLPEDEYPEFRAPSRVSKEEAEPY